MKQCSKCEEEKTINCFHKNNKSKDGLQSSCKACQYEAKKLLNDKKRTKNMTEDERLTFFEEQKPIIERRKKFIDLDSNCKKGNKICTVCLEEKPATTEFFNKDAVTKTGLDSICKRCMIKINKKRSLIKKEKNKNNIYNHKVYAHINKFNGKIYIGTTKNDVRDRWRKGKRYESNEKFYTDILKYGWDEGFIHEIIASNLTKEEGYNFEKILIKKLDTTNHNNGYNVVEGGMSHKIPDEVRLKISNTKKKNNPNKKEQQRMYRRNSKKVYCNGIIYASIREFCDEFSLHSSNTVGKWLNGKISMPLKFHELGLCFAENNKLKTSNGSKIICEDILYNSATECGKCYNIKPPTLLAWINGKNKMPQKFIELGLRYATEEDLSTYEVHEK